MKTKFLKLYGHQIEILESDPKVWNEQGLGRTNIKDNKIHLNSAMPESMKCSTLLHEVIHLVLDHNAHGEVSRDEKAVCALEVGLFTFLRDNPELVRELVGGDSRPPKKARRK